MTYYSWHPDCQGGREPASPLQQVTVYGRTGETGVCAWLLPAARTAWVPLPVPAPEQKICESSASGVCVAGKGPATCSQREISAPKRSRAAAVRGSAVRESLGMLINPPLGRYLLGKCLTFIRTSAVNREAFTFFQPSKAEGWEAAVAKQPAVLGGAQPAPGILGQAWQKQLK